MNDEQKRLAEELLEGHEKLPSFAKRLYFGSFDKERILPFPGVDATEEKETELLLGKLKTFLQNHVDADAIDRKSEIPPHVIMGLGELGILGMTIPKEHGGLGMSQHAYCKAEEAIGAHCGSTAVFVNVHQSVGLKALTLFGTPEQQKEWLPKLATGEYVAAFSLTEPGAGSDAGGVETTAYYNAEKKVYVLNGSKQWTSNGSIADMLTVMARTEDGKITAFIVSPKMAGFKVDKPSLEKVGIRGTKTANLSFTDMEVPEENILGEKGKGLNTCLTVLNYGRTTFGAICTGAAKFCLERTLKHARTREQFKRPLSSFPLIKDKIARMAAYVEAMDAMTYLTAGLLDAGQDDIMIESAMLKVFASESLWWIVYECMQVYGGRSFFTDQPLERMMRDARLNMVVEGANEVMRAFIGAVGLRDVGMTLKNGGVWSAAKGLLGQLKRPHIGLKSADLQREAYELERRIQRFGWTVPKLLARYKEEIVEEQLTLERVAMAAVQLYAMSAVLCRFDTEGGTGERLASVKYFCTLACDEFDRQIASSRHNNDAQMQELSDILVK